MAKVKPEKVKEARRRPSVNSQPVSKKIIEPKVTVEKRPSKRVSTNVPKPKPKKPIGVSTASTKKSETLLKSSRQVTRGSMDKSPRW